VQLLLAPFASPLTFVIFTLSIGLGAMIIIPALAAALSTEGRQPRWVRMVTSINARYATFAIIVAWAVTFGAILAIVPRTGANSPYGAIGLIALFTGFFAFMSFIWAVVRD
jgi:hypothetical protein